VTERTILTLNFSRGNSNDKCPNNDKPKDDKGSGLLYYFGGT